MARTSQAFARPHLSRCCARLWLCAWAVLAAPYAIAPALAQSAPEAPLSAIDWLSDTVIPSAPLASNATRALGPPQASEAPVLGGVPQAQMIEISVLDAPSADAVGLLPPSSTGLPRDLWRGGRASTVAAAISAMPAQSLPALRNLAIKLLLAEADAPSANPSPRTADAAAPPIDPPPPSGSVLLARIDKLLEMGALDQAYALIEAAGPTSSADLFRRAFDTSLLMGQEDRACRDMRAARGLDIAAPARIFCAARAGDWPGAQLTLRAETALGRIQPQQAELLARFLDPDAFETSDLPPPPLPITPLVWRIYDALGQTLPTGTLPLAFAHAELSPRAGWKAQAQAAERLARAGVLPPNQLLGIFTAQPPAASGGIWDRITAFQAFDRAMAARDAAAMGQALPAAYAAMKAAELEVPFAEIYAAPLAEVMAAGQGGDGTLGPAQEIAYELGLLSRDYERLAGDPASLPPKRAFLAGLARGDVAGGEVAGRVASGSLARAVAAGFAPAPPLPDDLAALVAEGRVGMAILAAMVRIETGLLGEDRAVSEGLALLRALGLEQAARRTALELMLLERRG